MKFKEISSSNFAEEFILAKLLTQVEGEQIEPQRELAERLGVSRNAIKYALKKLQHDGEVRIRNRKGMEINKKKDVNLLGMAPMSNELQNVKMRIQHLSSRLIKTPQNLLEFFGNDSNLVKIERVRFYNDYPFSYETAYLDEQKFNNISKIDFNNCSLYQILKDEYKEIPAYGYENITCVLADEFLSEMLDVDIKTPLYKVDSFNYSENDSPVEHTSQILPATNIKYHFKAKNIFDYQEDDADDII